MSTPRKGEPVDSPCVVCHRQPNAGEKYGLGAGDWDFSNICPECWDKLFLEDE